MKKKTIIVFDLETQTLIPDDRVIEPMRIAAGGFWSNQTNDIEVFSERTIQKFIDAADAADLVVSHNGLGFDYKILKKYLDKDPYDYPTWDTLAECQKTIGFRVGLDNLAKETLNYGKIGTGADAPDLYRSKQWSKLKKYLVRDVKLSKEIFYHGVYEGYLNYRTKKTNRFIRIDTSHWKDEIKQILEL